MSILWKMCGIDMHFDSNIGKWLSALSHSLTAFAGDADIADLSSVNEADDDVDLSDAFVDDDYDECDGATKEYEPLKDKTSNDAQYYSLEKQLWRQTKKISELRLEELFRLFAIFHAAHQTLQL